ncbi:3-ketoacyl-ACP reductase FabG2 [Enterovibrio paralichthyis]|uniref:3-ketoacyl-ACP reductase FabG2 n=1 Tax=Enterovibrio paralichthyis TaxID=2853805 RepID=UPI001C43D728|nr:3-ketoacyl-ACP reductase FabG2 [Enterovibrio paralichthyis]MBV7297790.1 3-ketoacyl-ACP reductase FabG2 [Enterovibrio paralichthyis]
MADNSQRDVLVTGASKGIGRAIALELAKAGFPLVVHYGRDRKGAEETQTLIAEHGSHARLITFDIADRAQCQTVIENDIAEHGAYYGVVNNAGVTADTAFPAMSSDAWDGVVHTNLDSFYNVLHPCILPMIKRRQGGRIVTMASVSGMMGNRGQTNYSAAKAGIIGATKALALELASRKITVNCVAPGLIDTGMVDEQTKAHVMPQVPMSRLGKPEEVAGLVAYLMSDNAGYITRQVISVNGGII